MRASASSLIWRDHRQLKPQSSATDVACDPGKILRYQVIGPRLLDQCINIERVEMPAPFGLTISFKPKTPRLDRAQSPTCPAFVVIHLTSPNVYDSAMRARLALPPGKRYRTRPARRRF